MQTLTELSFVQLRREFARILGVYEELIRPEMPLEWYVPREQRREFWARIRRQLHLRMPQLRLPPQMEQHGQWLSWGAAIRGALCGLCLAAKWLALPLDIVSFFVTWVAYRVVTRRWATEHPGIYTFGDLARSTLAHNMEAFRRRFALKPNRNEIFATMQVILSDALGVEQHEVTWEARLIDVLGAE